MNSSYLCFLPSSFIYNCELVTKLFPIILFWQHYFWFYSALISQKLSCHNWKSFALSLIQLKYGAVDALLLCTSLDNCCIFCMFMIAWFLLVLLLWWVLAGTSSSPVQAVLNCCWKKCFVIEVHVVTDKQQRSRWLWQLYLNNYWNDSWWNMYNEKFLRRQEMNKWLCYCFYFLTASWICWK